MPAIWTAAVVVALVVGWILLPGGLPGKVLHATLAAVLLLVFLRFAAWRLVVWRTTHVVFTTERILLRDGVFKRTQRDIPFGRMNEVRIEQTLFDQMLRCGALVVGPPGEHGQARLENIPDVLKAQVLINELIHGAGHQRGADVPDLEKTVGRLMSGNSEKPEHQPQG
jgi:uncharacterized membrane protein YdbT with pleckstrin-like domain